MATVSISLSDLGLILCSYNNNLQKKLNVKNQIKFEKRHF